MGEADVPASRGHFDRLAATYDELRRGGGDIVSAIAEENDPTGRVLDIGCGTGRLIGELARRFRIDGYGVEPSTAMLEIARARVDGATFIQGRAEELPFEDAFFDREVMLFVVHHLDRPRAFAELRRVLRRADRLTIANGDPDAVHNFWMAPLFPSYARIERERFPSAEALSAELLEAGFAAVRVRTFDEHRSFSREEALAKLRGRAYSTFEHMDDDEYRAGLERAERLLPGRIDYTLRLLLVSADT